MKHLSIDIETYCTQDIGKTGLFRYAEDPSFELLLFAYAYDFGDVRVIDVACGEKIPDEVLADLKDEGVIKHAYNAVFEITCLNRAGIETPARQWRDTMLHGLYLGYPAGLAKLGTALGLSEDKQKMTVGKALIRYFCGPCSPTARNGGRSRNLPQHDPDKWELFIEYNRRDVETEMEDYKHMASFPVPQEVQDDWVIDYELNRRGILLDKELYTGAIAIDEENRRRLLERATALTGLQNPNSREQLLSWINDHSDLQMDSLTKETVSEGLEKATGKIAEVLDIRRRLSKSSVSKYQAMETAVCADGRIRGVLQYYGAGRTGRWAGRLVQVQNLPHDVPEIVDVARSLVKKGDLEKVKLFYPNVSDLLSQLIRTAFIAPEGSLFCVADFSAIEARVIAWLAGEKWRMDVFKRGGDIYCASASSMFGVPVVKHGINGHLRQKGKVAELALGYQGGPGALMAMGAIKQGLSEDELPDIVARWRKASPRICDLWYQADEAAVSAVRAGKVTCLPHGLTFALEGDLAYGHSFLTITLPSGRKLFYPQPTLSVNQFGRLTIQYKTQINNRWMNASTYGGKLVENITQAVARDCLATALRNLEKAGYKPLMHIHDEVVLEVPREKMHDDELKRVIDIMCTPIPWAQGLVLNADGFISPYYKKD